MNPTSSTPWAMRRPYFDLRHVLLVDVVDREIARDAGEEVDVALADRLGEGHPIARLDVEVAHSGLPPFSSMLRPAWRRARAMLRPPHDALAFEPRDLGRAEAELAQDLRRLRAKRLRRQTDFRRLAVVADRMVDEGDRRLPRRPRPAP